MSAVSPETTALKPFLERLAEGVLVADGAMGTMLYARGVFVNRCFDELNLSNPALVRQVHEEYVAAGADLIETNTYGAQRLKLGPHGFDSQVAKINREGARLAREAAHGRAYVAGSIGPLGKPLEPYGSVTRGTARDAWREQAEALAEGGVDLFLVETLPSLDQALCALEAVRAAAPELPVAVSLTFSEDGTTSYGHRPEDIVRALEDQGVPVIGANCSQGPQPMLETIERMASATRVARLMAMPNAGAPALVEGRYVYLCTPEYMASYARRFLQAGVSLVGGCCGTTPAHIRSLVRSVRMLQPARAVVAAVLERRPLKAAQPPVAREKKSRLAQRLGKKFVVSVELDPPRGADPGRLIDRAQYCKEREIDAINVADGPRASARMSAQSLCLLMERQVGIETILHYTCRDRNLLGIQSDLLGAYALGLRNILAITGDPPKLGDYPDATAVYDVDSIGLIRIMSHLNHGCDLAGNPIGPPLGIHIGCGADPSRPDIDKEVRRLEAKVKAGAEYIMTQPVYDPRTVERFLGLIRHLQTPVLIGILPLYSHRNAEFLHNEVPGMSVPEEIRERMRRAGAGEQAQAEGVAIARPGAGRLHHAALQQGRAGRARGRRAALRPRPRRPHAKECQAPSRPGRGVYNGRVSCRPPIAWLAAALTFATPAFAAPDPKPVFGADVDVVHLTATVLDAKGDLVTDLEASDFDVLEEGRPQAVSVFGRAHEPGQDKLLALDLGLLFDTSQSMLEELKLSREAAVRFLDAIPRARELLTIFFDQDIRISRYDSENQQGLLERIFEAKGGGNTALYDSVAVYLSRVQDAPGRKVLVLFTDGEDSTSTLGLADVVDLLRASNVTAYVIAFWNTLGGGRRHVAAHAVLRQFASLTGGVVFSPQSSRDLPEIYDRILADLGAQYVLGFSSSDPRRDGRYRRLKVLLKGRRHGYKVRHREGYYAPYDDGVLIQAK